MRTITTVLIAFVFIFGMLYLLYSNQYKCKQKEMINQTKFEFLLLETLDMHGQEQAGKLLSGDIQRALLVLLDENDSDAMKMLCSYINQSNMQRLNKYDNNITIDYIEKFRENCGTGKK